MADPWVSNLGGPDIEGGPPVAPAEAPFADAEATIAAAQDAAQRSVDLLRHLFCSPPSDLVVRAYASRAVELLLLVLDQLAEPDAADAAVIAALTPWADDQAAYGVPARSDAGDRG